MVAFQEQCWLSLVKSTFNQANLYLVYSLAKLRVRTIERGEECEKEEWKPERTLTSATDVCAQSMLSALPPQEIQRMIQEVKDLDEDTLRVGLALA